MAWASFCKLLLENIKYYYNRTITKIVNIGVLLDKWYKSKLLHNFVTC